MDITESFVSASAGKFPDKKGRQGVWEVWANYCTRPQKNGGWYILAVEPDESNLPPAPDKQVLQEALERARGQVHWGSTLHELLRQDAERREARNEGWVYYPLERYPLLFLEFARLPDNGGLDNAATVDGLDTDKNAEAARNWASDYGVLGLTRTEPDDFGFRGTSTRGGKADTVAAFAYEAWKAHYGLRLYEAAIAKELDMDFIASRVSPRWRTHLTRTPARARAWALETVAIETQGKIAGNAFPAIYGEVGNFVAGWSFTNLLGAMWLQMFWLLTATEAPRRCEQCDEIISYEQPEQPQGKKKRGRKKERFCSKECSNHYYYLTRTKPSRQADRELQARHGEQRAKL